MFCHSNFASECNGFSEYFQDTFSDIFDAGFGTEFGGEFAEGDRAPYGYGRLNDNVYPVNGGMEDWAYAASWEAGTLKRGCEPTTFGGYDITRTNEYDSASVRAFNILVETSDDKSPPDGAMGRCRT